MRTGRRKSFSLTVCVLLVFVTLVSLFYIANEENHHCTGEDCPICASIHQAEQTVRNLGTGMPADVVANPMPVLCFLLSLGLFLFISVTSLVTQKVRLND